MKTLGERLNELAEVFDKKPVSEKGLSVWFGVLREFPTERVCGVLIGWAKTHTKFPSPAEVWKVVNDIGIRDREDQAEKENREAFFQKADPQNVLPILEGVRALLRKPRSTPTEHWQRNLIRFPADHIGHEYAIEALKSKSIVESVPGEDDEMVKVA